MEVIDFEQLTFDERGLIPVVVQDEQTRSVLMLAYADEEALRLTCQLKEAHFYSRSRDQLWKKGETSGNLQEVVDIRVDCDADAVLYLVIPAGPACHTGKYSCFHRFLSGGSSGRQEVGVEFLNHLYEIIVSRLAEMPQNSYVASLKDKGLRHMVRKLCEENTEVTLSALTVEQPGFVEEMADLWFHSLVLLAHLQHSLADVCRELHRRHHTD